MSDTTPPGSPGSPGSPGHAVGPASPVDGWQASVHPQQLPQAPSGSPRPPSRAPNAFAGVPVSDYLCDAAAVALLLVSLALPWTFADRASDRVEVVLITVLSVFSLSLPYLARVGVFGSSWSVQRTRTVRLLMNAPYLVLVLVYLVLDVVARGSDDFQGNLIVGIYSVTGLDVGSDFGADGGFGFGIFPSAGGLGTAAALGAAGALLAAQPRRSELGPPHLDHVAGRMWSLALRIGAGVTAVLAILSIALFLIDLTDLSSLEIDRVLLGLAATAAVVGLVSWPAFATASGSDAWRLTLMGLGVAAVTVFVFGAGDSSSLPRVQSLSVAGFGLILLPALAAVAASPALARTLTAVDDRSTWTAVARNAFIVAAVAGVVRAVMAMAYLLSGIDESTTRIVLLLVFSLLAAVAGVAGWSALRSGGLGARSPALALAAGVLLAGIVLVVVAAGSDVIAVSWLDLFLAFALPATVGIALLAPPAMRPAPQERPNNPTAAWQWQAPPVQQAQPAWQAQPPLQTQQAQPQQAQPSPQAWHAEPSPPTWHAQPSAQAPVAPEPSPDQGAPPPPLHSWTARAAADPATPGETLARIVTEAPELRPYVAANPSTYPALLQWLADIHDPQVDAALQARPPAGS